MQTLIDFSAPRGEDGSKATCYAFGVPCETLVAHRLEQIAPLLEKVHELSLQGRWCVGYLRYEAAAAFDPALAVHKSDGPLAWFGVHDAPQAWSEVPTDDPARVSWRDELSYAAFNQGVDQIHQAISAGALYQVNYTSQLLGELRGSPRDLFFALRRAQPGGYAAFIDTGDEQVLSVSPELFFDWDGKHILARPMKGTAPRGKTPEDDANLAAQLHASAKERAENVMIVDLIRNDLSRIAQPFSVKVSHLFRLQALPAVWQMTSDVEARTQEGTTLADVFTALFPCGSITGAPKVSAMHMIKELEASPRGVYCGTVGLVRPGGAATFNVAIRTVTVRGQTARCGIGSGITADATAENEWQEWRHKRAFLDRASQPFELLETMALLDGTLRDAPAHLARMAHAAQHFGYPWVLAQLEASLERLINTHRQGLWRVRLRLDARGQVQLEAFEMGVSPVHARLALAATQFDAADSEFVRFKTTRRAHYDAFAPCSKDIFDTLLWNSHGEITECTRGNVAVRLDGRWVTPPIRCGLLNGVGRDRHLREGRLVEAVVKVDDLPRASGLAFVNSLRGWIDATLV